MRRAWTRRPGATFFLLTGYALWGAVTLRWITEFIEEQHPLLWAVSGILLLFGVLLGIEPLLTGRSAIRAHAYLVLQTGLVFAASLFYFELDFFALLYVPLCGQGMYLFTRRTGLAWLGVLVFVTALGQLIQFGGLRAIPFTLLYAAGLFLVAVLVSMTLQADQARRDSERLLTELEQAHARLRAYADQAEELAVANERTRLARDLHDSVAQTLYGLTLQAEAAGRQLAAGNSAAVADYLAAMGADAQQTLQETRLLIFELRPPLLEAHGLRAAIKARLETVEARSGLDMDVRLRDVGDLPTDVENGLYRILQEALNNSARHARARTLRVVLARTNEAVQLEVADDGCGFDPTSVTSGRLGLQGMAERTAHLAGRLTVDSAPGRGTRIFVEIPV